MRRIAAVLFGCFFVHGVASLRAATPCAFPVNVSAGTTLADLATRHLGDARFAVAIALATNSRTGAEFKYIADPDSLGGTARVCVPSKEEAADLQSAWDAYDRAVGAARLPRTADVHNEQLVTIAPGSAVDVVAWVREDQRNRLKLAAGRYVGAVADDTWVTVEPHLRDFCQTFARAQKANADAVTRRVEQRLGLAPASNKSFFVRMRVASANAMSVFRPCSDPSIDKAGCVTGLPGAASAPYLAWFQNQYYSSYGKSLFSEFPWTALGYTFDWAPGKGSEFERIGESEFVVYKNTPVKILEDLPTAEYCSAAVHP